MNPTGDNIKEDEKFKYLSANFSGGMRRNTDPSELEANEYALLINGRSRYGSITPIKLPTDLSSEMPAGRFQGIYGFDTILIVFKDGQLYARDYSQLINAFGRDNDFQLSSQVDTIFAQSVPASWFNVNRKAEDDTTQNTPILIQDPVHGTPQALVCQDGENRPRLVFSVGSSRVAKDINDWVNTEDPTQDTREYVPIGKQMMYHDSILYIVSPDGKDLYRSVTGRPLDFVIAVDTNGNKLPVLTSGKPEASRLSYAVDYNPITCLKSIPSPQPTDTNLGPGFFVGTLKGSWMVFPDYAEQVFAEPTFVKVPLFPTGPLNQESITDVLGDVAMTTDSSITTFNSVQTLANEGKNSPFFDDVYKLFEGIIQDITASITTDNYAFLGVKTIYGYGILIYDCLRQKHVSFDIYPTVTTGIKQFAEIKVNGRRRLFFITATQIFEWGTGETATTEVYFREMKADDREKEIKPRRIRITLRDILEDGTITLTPFVGGLRGTIQSQKVTANVTPTNPITSRPFGTGDAKNITNKTFLVEVPDIGETIGIFLTMDFMADLLSVETVTEEETKPVTNESGGEAFQEILNS